ncbi:MAG: AAA family ATPase, partial [Myxococcales bacterium]|nr:AAA family ATPase [Myxococcales bacterium]
RVRSPLELLLAVWLAEWLLPKPAQTLLEIQLITTALSWMLGGAVVVQTIDALASDEVLGGRMVSNASESATLRLRSLRLVGRAVVVIGLILAMTIRLVGRGTIHSWVWSTCWISGIPLFAVLVRWWQPLIYERVGLVRKKTWFDTWVLGHQQGAASFFAAAAASVVLFARGIAHVVKTRVLTFDATRRALAYLFRRGLSKKAEDISQVTSAPLSPALHVALGPETHSTEVVESIADEQLDDIIHRIDAPGGGVFAVVGERGSGKTMLLGRIAETSEAIVQVRCRGDGLAGLTAAVNASLDLPPETPLAEAAEALASRSEDSALLIDDAHHLILPMMGGLADFDRVLDVARSHSDKCTWVFALDEVIWTFFERARGARPLFDEVIHLVPWSEGAIVRLLTHRTEEHGLSPNFGQLVADGATDMSPEERAEAVARIEASYYRLLWDYAGGNPGVALHFWRACLGLDEAGKVVVRLFDAPTTEALEQLPDDAVFVLRAVVQLGVASESNIAKATSLRATTVADALRHGLACGYLEKNDGHYCVTWNWFRAITRFLSRRHLITSSV